MALSWNISKVRDWRKLTEDQAQNAMLESAIWATMSVGMWRIKDEADAMKFFQRISFLELSTGAMRRKNDPRKKDLVPVYFTLDDCKRLIGLETNASALTDQQFIKRRWQRHCEDAQHGRLWCQR